VYKDIINKEDRKIVEPVLKFVVIVNPLINVLNVYLKVIERLIKLLGNVFVNQVLLNKDTVLSVKDVIIMKIFVIKVVLKIQL